MADLEQTGVQLVALGRDEYLASLQAAQKATVDFNKAAGDSGSGLQGMSAGSLAVATTVGSVLGNAITGTISKVIELSQSAVMMASSLQDTRITIESLTAQEVLNTGAASNMNDAMEQAGPITDEVMNRLKKLSLQSPFEYQQILSVFSMNKAFGQSIETSLDLTKAITNIGAVMKGVPGVLDRLSYNFSQMAMTGQITSRDIRDLAMAGVDLRKVLQDQLGMSVDEVNTKLKSGQMTFEEVSKAFVGYVDKNFGTAAERASKTFSGLISSFKDLSFFSSIDVFGGALDQVTAKMGKFFDGAMNFVNNGGLKPVGAALEVFTGEILNLGEVGLNAGSDFFNEFGDQIMNTAESAFNWGSNVAIQLASGLIEGAATAISAAMDYVSGMLSFWLAPGSPPRVAPDIDTWGTAAMEQFLGGFGDADFDALSGVESALNSALSAMVSAGTLDSGDQLGIYQSISKQLTDVIATGGDVTPVLNSIKSSLGDWGGAVADLTVKELALSKTLKAVQDAQDALNKANEAATKANDDLARITDEYNELAKAGASPEILAAKRAEFETAKKARTEANKAAVQAQDSLDTAQKEADSLKDKVDLQKDLIKQLVDMTKTEKEKDKKKEKDKTGLGNMAAAAKKGVSSLPKVSADTSKLKEQMDKLKADLKEKLDTAFQPLVDSWNRAKQIVGNSWDTFSKTIGDTYTKYIQPATEGIGKLIPPDLVKNIGFAIGLIATFSLGFKVLSGVIGIVSTVLGGVSWPLLAIIGAIALLKTAWDNNWGGIRDILTNIWNGTVLPALQTLWTWLQTNIPIALQTLSNFWQTTLLPAIQTVWAWMQTSLFPALSELWNWLSTNIPVAIQTVSAFWTNTLQPALQTVWAWMQGSLFPALSTLWNWLSTNIPIALQTLSDFWTNTLLPAIQVVWGWLSGTLFPFLGSLANLVSAVLGTAFMFFSAIVDDVMRDAVIPLWNAMSTLLKPIFDTIGKLLRIWLIIGFEEFSGILEMVGGVIGDMIAKYWNGLVGSFQVMSELLNKVTGLFNRLANALRSLSLPSWLTPGSPTPLEIGIGGVLDAVTGLLGNAALNGLKTLLGALAAPLESVGNAFVNIVQSASGLAASLGTTLTAAVNVLINLLRSSLVPIGTMISTLLTAIQTALINLATFLTSVLLVNLTTLATWVTSIFVPLLQALAQFFSIDFIANLQTFIDYWNGVVFVAMTTMNDYIQNSLFDLIKKVSNYFANDFIASLTAFLGTWNGIFKESISGVYHNLVDELFPTMKNISDFMRNDWTRAIKGVADALDRAADAVDRLSQALASLSIPDWFTPGSPTPLEIGVRGITAAMKTMNNVAMRDFNSNLAVADKRGTRAFGADATAAMLNLASSNAGASTVEKHYSLTLNTKMEPQTVQQGFDAFRLLGAGN